MQALRLAANEVLYSPPASLPATIDLPRLPPAGDLDYRLCRCERFRVYADGRKLGVVEGARFESRADRPDLLEVRSRPFGRHSLLIPVSEVEAVHPDEKAVIVAQARRTAGARERLHARLGQLQAFLH